MLAYWAEVLLAHMMNAKPCYVTTDPQTKATDLHCASTYRLPVSTPIIIIYNYYSVRKLIIVLPSSLRQNAARAHHSGSHD